VNDGKTTLTDDIVTKLADEVGIDLPKQKVCSSKAETIEFCKNIYPVVMKATNAAIAHKTDFKAVYLDIKNEEELSKSYDELSSTIKAKTGLQTVEVLIQEFIKYEELFLIGANRDGDSTVYNPHTPGFGHLIVFGQGGIYTEIYKDLGYALAPATDKVIRSALATTKIFKIMLGARGKEALAYEKAIEAIKSIQKLVLLYPEIASLDINPLLLTTKRATAVDIKIFV
jgi:acetyltransferase